MIVFDDILRGFLFLVGHWVGGTTREGCDGNRFFRSAIWPGPRGPNAGFAASWDLSHWAGGTTQVGEHCRI